MVPVMRVWGWDGKPYNVIQARMEPVTARPDPIKYYDLWVEGEEDPINRPEYIKLRVPEDRICLCTGITDANGVMVFENDVVCYAMNIAKGKQWEATYTEALWAYGQVVPTKRGFMLSDGKESCSTLIDSAHNGCLFVVGSTITHRHLVGNSFWVPIGVLPLFDPESGEVLNKKEDA